jgi:hypothetical protein
MGWFRLYDDVVNDLKVQQLSPKLFKFWINFLCISSKFRQNGTLPELNVIAYQLRVSPEKAHQIRDDLLAAGLVDFDGTSTYRCHNWDKRQFASDSSTERVKRFRNGQRNVADTVTETPLSDQIRYRSDPSPTPSKANFKKVRPNGSGDWNLQTFAVARCIICDPAHDWAPPETYVDEHMRVMACPDWKGNLK